MSRGESPRHDALAAVGAVLDALDVPHRPGAASLKVRMQRGVIKPGQVLLESEAGAIRQVHLLGAMHISYGAIDPKTFDPSAIWVVIDDLSAAEARQYLWIVQPTHYNQRTP